MHVTIHLAGVLLLLAAPLAGAQSSLPDPVAPAVVGRPLDQIRPARPHRPKVAAAKPTQRKQVVSTQQTVHTPQAAVAVVPAPAQPGRAAQVAEEASRATHVAGNAPAQSGYFSSRDLALVRSYYAAHPVTGQGATWKLGEPIPAKADLTGVPDDLRHALTPLPPGHQYVQVDGDVVLVTMQSRVVVAGISRGAR